MVGWEVDSGLKRLLVAGRIQNKKAKAVTPI